jgi:GNAT superfamily N-acetyltransferase
MHSLNSIKQLETIERRVMDDFFRYAPETTRRQLGLRMVDIANARLYLADNENDIMLNRVVGLGSTSPISEKDLEEITQIYSSNGVDRFFVMVQPWLQPAQAWNWLFELGLTRDRGWTQFLRGAEPASPVPTRLRIKAIGSEYAREFARIAATGFGLSRQTWPALESLVGKPGWHHFMSFSGDRPAGVAALYTDNGFAWFDWAATDPEFRAQGSQSGLLHARIRKALELGCRSMGSETGEAVAGDPQHSFNNLVRAGFVPAYTRDNFSVG